MQDDRKVKSPDPADTEHDENSGFATFKLGNLGA
jgi:hypothetical protein